MSKYLIDRVAATPNIDVRLNSEVVRARRGGRLEALDIRDSLTGHELTLAADGLFVLIGGRPLTAGVAGWLRRDEHGFLMTGRDLLDQDDRNWWPLERDPYPLEASHPGVFVAGDVRHGSSKRVASAVGEGSMAIQLVHRYFADPDPAGDRGSSRPSGGAGSRRVVERCRCRSAAALALDIVRQAVAPNQRPRCLRDAPSATAGPAGRSAPTRCRTTPGWAILGWRATHRHRRLASRHRNWRGVPLCRRNGSTNSSPSG